MNSIRMGVVGAGFWSNYQLAAWRELGLTQCVAICDPDRSKAESLARQFGVHATYADLETMLTSESLDFIDIISSPGSHERLVTLAAAHRVPVICQKPMAEDLAACERMVAACQATGTWFAIHENWRWQSTLRRVQQLFQQNRIGSVFRCRIDFVTGFDVFANQPTLRDCQRFIIADLGCHLLDYARCLFGEASSLHCQTQRVSGDIQGEDVASINLWMNDESTMVQINLAYARTPLEIDCFPQTRLLAEGTQGSLEVGADYGIRICDPSGVTQETAAPKLYSWAHPQYAIVHSSLLDCNAHLLNCLIDGRPAETSGEDNFKSMELVFAAYESARLRQVVMLESHSALPSRRKVH